MKLARIRYIKILLGLLIVLVSYHQIDAQENSLKNQRIDLHLENSTFNHLLSSLVLDHKVPIGIEISDLESNANNINISVKNTKLEDILNLALKFEPNYKWEINNGVVNFTPIHYRDNFVERFLNTKVKSFVAKKDDKYFKLKENITTLPEIKTLFNTYNVNYYKYGVVTQGSVDNVDVDINLRETTVKNILNTIITESNRKFWSINRIETNKEYLIISL